MDSNIYSAPEANLENDSAGGAEFYVVTKAKFLVLYFGTFGIYSIYWFYRHWKEYKRASGENMLPVMRAIFSVFFAYPLFITIQARLEEAERPYKWRPKVMAIIYIVAVLLSYFSDRLSSVSEELTILDFISVIMVPVIALPLLSAQMAANIACGDEKGGANKKFTLLNCLWLFFGAVIWCVFFFGAYIIFFVI
ncbi:DUF4234 domain-containing protein [Microbulbifer sp. THAF38]|uniref:DUF4234 domain-containing protein n=1 Tax=Microbulbifer sp. THAF38 TaxID=2587856 RepID=UPI0012696ED8|nr:DUF4234 domain-containing protein [Microbulbifer sp. THAF38]QFT56826.1 hypothetical protein FIU95_19930 [Microbulbifer sp. THAF38]